MYSPRSVSTGSMPFASRCSLRPISSAIIDLPLVTVRAPALRQIDEDQVARLRGGLGIVDVAAGGMDLVLVGLEIEVEMLEGVVLDVACGVAQLLELGQGGGGLGPLLDEADPDVAERLLEVAGRGARASRWP